MCYGDGSLGQLLDNAICELPFLGDKYSCLPLCFKGGSDGVAVGSVVTLSSIYQLLICIISLHIIIIYHYFDL